MFVFFLLKSSQKSDNFEEKNVISADNSIDIGVFVGRTTRKLYGFCCCLSLGTLFEILDITSVVYY